MVKTQCEVLVQAITQPSDKSTVLLTITLRLSVMEVLKEAPQTGSFVPLAEHQSTTPASFHNGPPVLHYYSDRCKVIVLEHELRNAPALSEVVTKLSQATHSNDQGESNGNDSAKNTLEEIDVWVTSEYVKSIPLTELY